MKQRSKRAMNKLGSMRKDATQAGSGTPAPAFAGKPLDGSQYLDVIEEQAYADRRPTPEEQKPRFSILDKQSAYGKK